MVNSEFGLDQHISNVIFQTCSEILKECLNDQFLSSAFQPGSGIHTDMNINEVIANRAMEIVNVFVGNQIHLDPTCHVNMNQNQNNAFSIGKQFFYAHFLAMNIAFKKKLNILFKN